MPPPPAANLASLDAPFYLAPMAMRTYQFSVPGTGAGSGLTRILQASNQWRRLVIAVDTTAVRLSFLPDDTASNTFQLPSGGTIVIDLEPGATLFSRGDGSANTAVLSIIEGTEPSPFEVKIDGTPEVKRALEALSQLIQNVPGLAPSTPGVRPSRQPPSNEGGPNPVGDLGGVSFRDLES